jgi:hypothetical protein
MKEHWEDIFKGNLENDAVTPSENLWNQIESDLWTSKISNQINQEHASTPSPKLAKNIFKHPSIASKSTAWIGKGAGLSWTIGVSALTLLTATWLFYPTKEHIQPKNIEKNTILNETNISSQTLPYQTQNQESNPDQETRTIEEPITTVHSSVTTRPHDKNTPPLGNSIKRLLSPSDNAHLQNTAELNQGPFFLSPENAVMDPALISKQLQKEILWKTLNLVQMEIPTLTQPRMHKIAPVKVQGFVGLQKNLSQQTLHKRQENLDIERNPPQRIWGLQAAWIVNEHWILESGFVLGNQGYKRKLMEVAYFDAPVRINPMRRVMRIQSEHIQKYYETHSTVFHPQGINVRDNQNYYKINYEESVSSAYYEIPILVGYMHRWGTFQLSAQIGGRYLIPYQTSANIQIEILNPQKSQFNSEMNRNVSGKSFFQGMGQLKTGWLFHPQWELHINNIFLPHPSMNSKIPLKWGGLQAGINYCF